MLAVIYARISKDREGAGLGVERQRADCEELAERIGWTIVATYTDNDISAYSGRRRPGYESMCADLENGKAQGLVVWHADRLHRRPVELESFIDLCDRRGIQVQTVQSGSVDLSTASGKMVARMLGAAARHEVEHSVERAKRAKAQAAADGKFRGGRRSFGFEPNGMTVRPDEAAAIRKACDDLLAGVSMQQIARTWTAAGLRTSYGGREINSRDLRRILLRHRNAGIVLHEGKPVGEGKWEKIIDADTFAAVQAVLGDPSRKTSPGSERRYQGSGVYLCGKCGAPMFASAHNKTKSDGWRRTYTCSKTKHLARDVEHVDALIDGIVVARLSQPDAAIALGDPVVEEVHVLHGQREGLRARLDELSALFADGSIDGPQLKRGTADLRKQLEAAEARLASARSASALADLILAGDDLRRTWASSPPDVRGKIIDALMTVTVLPVQRGRKPGGAYFDPQSVDISWKA